MQDSISKVFRNGISMSYHSALRGTVAFVDYDHFQEEISQNTSGQGILSLLLSTSCLWIFTMQITVGTWPQVVQNVLLAIYFLTFMMYSMGRRKHPAAEKLCNQITYFVVFAMFVFVFQMGNIRTLSSDMVTKQHLPIQASEHVKTNYVALSLLPSAFLQT